MCAAKEEKKKYLSERRRVSTYLTRAVCVCVCILVLSTIRNGKRERKFPAIDAI